METSPTFELSGGHPVLDFVNTLGGKRQVRPREDLRRYADLLSWASLSGVLSEAETRALGREAAAHPREAEQALERARSFRESIHQLLMALLEGRPAPVDALARLDAEVHRASGARRLQQRGGVYGWTSPDVALADSVVPRLALAAAELLTSETLKRVRVCEATQSDSCGWLFLDQTRNHSRRWCSMATCGNQHKARRHYARVRARG